MMVAWIRMVIVPMGRRGWMGDIFGSSHRPRTERGEKGGERIKNYLQISSSGHGIDGGAL